MKQTDEKKNSIHSEQSRLRILVLNYEYPPLGGGAAPVSRDLSIQLAKCGHQVDVLTMWYQGLPEEEWQEGVHVRRLKCLRTRKASCKPWEQYTYLWAVRRYLKKFEKAEREKNASSNISLRNCYDVVYCHFVIPTGEAARWVKKTYGIPYIITAHGSDVEGHNRKWSMRMMHRLLRGGWRRIVREASFVTAPSQHLIDLMKHNFPDGKYAYIPNGIDFDKYASLAEKHEKKKQILIMGRLQRFKGVQTILQAIGQIDWSKNPDWQVEILGDGPYREELEKQAADMHSKWKVSGKSTVQCAPQIHFRGWLDNGCPQQLQAIAESRIYITASQFENCPMSVIEAASAGCRVLLSDIPGHRQFGFGENVYFPVDDAEALARLLDIQLSFSAKVCEGELVDGYAWEKIIGKYEAFLRQAYDAAMNS